MAIRYFIFFILFLYIPVSYSTNEDSLLDIIEANDTPQSVLFQANLDYGWTIRSTQPQLAERYTNEALKIAEDINNDQKIADALSNLGVIFWQQGKFEEALDRHMQANQIYNNIENEEGIAKTYSNIGIIFSDQSHYEKALEYFFKAMIIYENNDNERGMSILLNNIGMVYEFQKDYGLAEEYHQKSLKLKEKLEDISGMAFSYSNLGLVYQGLNEYEKAMDYFERSLKIRKELNNLRQVAVSYKNIGYLYFLMDSLMQARQYLINARQIFNEVNDQSGLSMTLNYLGRLAVEENNYRDAQFYFENSLLLAQEIGLNRMITKNYLDLAAVMQNEGKYQEAFKYQKSYIQKRDSIYSSESKRKIFELQLMYDREKRENEMQILRKNEQITQLNLQRDRLLKNFLIIAIILVLVSLFLLYNRFLIARNANSMLEKQKEEISETNEQLVELNQSLLEQKKMYEDLNKKMHISNKKLKESEKNLKEINATKDKFFSIISHDLRNPFASIVSFSRILKRDILNMSKDELKQLALELDKSVLKIDNLLENLLQWSRTQTGKIKYKPEYLAMHEIIKDNLNLLKNNARDKEIDLIDKVDENLVVYSDKNMADTVVRNLISNALKYTNINGRIEVISEVKDHMAYISIKDNGVGMPEENKQKIFRTDSLHSTYGTMDEKGSGLGLLLCKEFVEKQGGSITFESKLNEGSTFTFSMPVEES